MKFEPAGPARFRHQRTGLAKMLATGGVTALLFDPGTGKTAVVLDYAGLLALKSPTGEARVLVVCPLVAVDTWVLQSKTFVTEQVHLWIEAIGGSILTRGETLASRGGQPYATPLGYPSRIPADPPEPEQDPNLPGETVEHSDWRKIVARNAQIRRAHRRYAKALVTSGPRALHWGHAMARYARGQQEGVNPADGPDALGTGKPRLVIEVVNIDSITSRSRVGSGTMADVMVDAIRRFNPDLVVMDESHKIKAVTGNASRVMARVAEYVRRRVLLTGTVMPHSPLDVFAQWRFLAPYAFGSTQPDGSIRRATYGTFRNRYADMGGWMGREVIGFHNLDEMQQIMAANAVVARKDEVLDLPKTTDVVIPVLLSAAEKQAYQDMADALVVDFGGNAMATATNRLTQMMRLRQITSGHLPDDSGTVREIGQAKANTVRSLVQDTLTGEKRIVVFALFTHEIRALAKALAEKGTEVMVIAGQTSGAERTRLRARFGSDDPTRMVMIAQIKTMSLAVNELVTANHAIFASLSQQRDDFVQARDRLDRIGQTRPVTFWYALAPGTVDEVIMASHRDRTNLEDAMLKHIREVHENGLLSDVAA